MNTPADPRRVQPEQSKGQRVLSGVVLGIVLCFFVGVIATVAEVAAQAPVAIPSDASDPVSPQGPTTPFWWWLALFSLPVVGLVILLVPQWRRAGAGLVMGLAIGSVVFAGVCGAWIGAVP